MGGKEESVVERCRVTVVVGLALVVENGSVSGYSWHIGAAWRPLTFPRLSPPLPLSLSFRCSVSFYRYAPSFSVSSFSPSFLFNSPGVSLSASRYTLRLVLSARCVPPAAPCERTHGRTGDRLRARESDPSPLVDSFHSRVYSSGFDPSRLRSLRPLDAGIPLRSPPFRCFVLLSVSLGCDYSSPPPPPRQRCCSLLRPAFISATKPPRRYSGPDDDKRETVH